MRRVLGIARLTFSEGVRMRIVLIFLFVLALLVLRMPFALRGDETLAGRLQNFLSYSMGALGFLLSLSTIFFSCATLSNEFRNRSLHMVVTKPVKRFEILLGKWLGVNLLNLLIVVLSGAVIYGFAYFIQSRPEQFARDRYMVRDVVWTARATATPVVPVDNILEMARDRVSERLETGEIEERQKRAETARLVEEFTKRWRQVEPSSYRIYEFEDLAPPDREDTVVQIRFKARGIPLPYEEMLDVGWVFLDPETGAPLHEPIFTHERVGNTHQFLVQAEPVIRDGQAILQVINPVPPVARTTIYFEGEDTLELLYKVGSFEANFVKALFVILLQLALLSALGLFFSVFVSFPVACLCISVFYVLCLGMPFWMESIGANVQYVTAATDPYGSLGPAIRGILVPLMEVVFPNFAEYSAIGHIVDGEYVPIAHIGRATLHTLAYGVAVLLLPGWFIFRFREVAEVTV